MLATMKEHIVRIFVGNFGRDKTDRYLHAYGECEYDKWPEI